MNRALRLIIVFFITGLAACTVIAPPTVLPKQSLSWQQHQQIVNKINNWQIQGKIAVQTSQESGSAIVTWKQQGHQFNLSLVGPLGSPHLSVIGQPGRVSVTTAEGKTLTAATAEQLLRQAWGFDLPISHLSYWIRGLPAPQLPAKTQLKADQHLATLEQAGWTIQFLAYQSIDNVDLPKQLTISAPHFKTKIIIYDWKIAKKMNAQTIG